MTDVIKNADVVLTTLTGALSRKLEGTSFDLVIIDEAAQALEIACWIALLKVITDSHTNIYGLEVHRYLNFKHAHITCTTHFCFFAFEEVCVVLSDGGLGFLYAPT